MEVIKALKKTIYKTDEQIGAWLNLELGEGDTTMQRSITDFTGAREVAGKDI
jgi:hypothetical protein